MTKEEVEKLVSSKKYSNAIKYYGDDKLRNLIKEIYIDGMKKGYEIAKYRLEQLYKMPISAGEDYLNDNMEDIRNMINLCEKYQECEE